MCVICISVWVHGKQPVTVKNTKLCVQARPSFVGCKTVSHYCTLPHLLLYVEIKMGEDKERLTRLKQRIEMVMQHTKPNSRCFRVMEGNQGSGTASSPPSQLFAVVMRFNIQN